VFSCLNVRSLNSKLNDLLEVRHDHCIDVLLLTETWHDDDSVCIRRLRADGYTVVERAQPRLAAASPLAVNHGGVAAVAAPGVHLTIVNTGPQPTTFESVCARVTSASTSCIVLLIYRPGSVATSSLFFDELAAILDNLVTLPTPLVVAGDINVRLDRPDDPAARQLMSLLAEHGLSCRVNSPTHTAGGLLDIVATRLDLPAPTVDVIDVGLSDHRLLRWSASVDRPTAPVYTTTVRRPWHRVNSDELRSSILTSRLAAPDALPRSLDVDALAELYDTELLVIADRLASCTYCHGSPASIKPVV